MQPNYLALVRVFGSEIRHTVPLFQRPYVWEREGQWEPLWTDLADLSDRVLRARPTETIAGHFLGTVVLEQAIHSSGTIARREIIDGQQRLITLQIILRAAEHAIAAVANLAKKRGDEGGQKSADVASRQLGALTRNPAYADEEEQYKVWPTNEDRVPFREVMDARSSLEQPSTSSRIMHAYHFFHDAIQEWIGAASGADSVLRATALASALKDHVRIIVLDLDDTDEPQAIFETLNAHGTPLLPADLIKNWLLWEATRQNKPLESLYRSYWQDFDKDQNYWREIIGVGHAARARVDTFLQNWLTRKTRDSVPSKHLYDRFLKYVAPRDPVSGTVATPDVQRVMSDIHKDAGRFRLIENPSGRRRFDRFLERIATMDVGVFYPVILELMDRDGSNEEDLDSSATKLESYLVRRMVCAQQTRGYGTLAIDILNALKDTKSLAAPILDQYLSERTGSQRWPSDVNFEFAWTQRRMYGGLRRQRIIMLLEAIEEYYELGDQKGEPIVKFDFSKLQIEHILPQEWKAHWPLVGGETEATREDSLHRIGNLTLVSGKLNPTLSNAPWLAPGDAKSKRRALEDHSRLQLNALIVKNHEMEWNNASIEVRASDLFEVACRIWPAPNPLYESKEPSRDETQQRLILNEGAPNARDGRVISLLVDHNPKRVGSASRARFDLYRNGQTAAEYVAACIAVGQPRHKALADLIWDVNHQFISLA